MVRYWSEVVELSDSWKEVGIESGEEMCDALTRCVNGGIFLVKKLFVVLFLALSSLLAACSSLMTLQV